MNTLAIHLQLKYLIISLSIQIPLPQIPLVSAVSTTNVMSSFTQSGEISVHRSQYCSDGISHCGSCGTSIVDCYSCSHHCKCLFEAKTSHSRIQLPPYAHE